MGGFRTAKSNPAVVATAVRDDGERAVVDGSSDGAVRISRREVVTGGVAVAALLALGGTGVALAGERQLLRPPCEWRILMTADRERRCTCGGVMKFSGRQALHMNGSPFFLESSTEFTQVDVYVCPDCRKVEFYLPELPAEESLEENAMRLYATASEKELRAILADPDYPPDVHRGVRRLLEQRTGHKA